MVEERPGPHRLTALELAPLLADARVGVRAFALGGKAPNERPVASPLRGKLARLLQLPGGVEGPDGAPGPLREFDLRGEHPRVAPEAVQLGPPPRPLRSRLLVLGVLGHAGRACGPRSAVRENRPAVGVVEDLLDHLSGFVKKVEADGPRRHTTRAQRLGPRPHPGICRDDPLGASGGEDPLTRHPPVGMEHRERTLPDTRHEFAARLQAAVGPIEQAFPLAHAKRVQPGDLPAADSRGSRSRPQGPPPAVRVRSPPLQRGGYRASRSAAQGSSDRGAPGSLSAP